MTQQNEQLCPLCDQSAEFEVVHEPYGKRFTCSSCTEFFIDSSTESRIRNFPEVTRTEFRERARKQARNAGVDHLFVLREPRSDELGGDGHGVARTTIVGELIPLGR